MKPYEIRLIITLFAFLDIVSCAVDLQDFYPFGPDAGDTSAARNDDGFTPLQLRFEYPFFNETYSMLWVNNNGGISFKRGISEFTPRCGALDATSTMVAPFWADIHIGIAGDIYFRETSNTILRRKATEEIRRVFPHLTEIGWLFIVTWNATAFYGSNSCGENATKIRNTFQVVLATDGVLSFSIFNYNEIKWTTGTASGGNCSGLGGNYAKAGFDVGNGVTFYEIPGSCSDAILDIVDTSNVEQPGKWIFRVDSSLESGQCDSDRYKDRKLLVWPNFVTSFGNVPFEIRGPCFDTAISVICRFNTSLEGVDRFVNVTGIIDFNNNSTNTNAAYCQVPYLYSYGRTSFEMILISKVGPVEQEFVYMGYLYVIEPEEEIHVRFGNNSGNSSSVEFSLQWDPLIFGSNVTTKLLELVLMKYSGVKWSDVLTVSSTVQNSGNYSGVIRTSAQLQRDTFVTFRLKEAGQDARIIFGLLGRLIFGGILLFYPAPVSQANEDCRRWYQSDPGPPTDILPCPPNREQAQEDFRFEPDASPDLAYYHPGADASFRQRIPSPSGAGQQCVYSKSGTIMVGPPGGGTADMASPKGLWNIMRHYFLDVRPWTLCCKASDNCDLYYEKRPSDGGNTYIPPRPAGGRGDPHITTFDLFHYTFNGAGEFWMVKSIHFSIQARMESLAGENVNATVFTAFVMSDSDYKVQIQLSVGKLEVLLNGEQVVFDDGVESQRIVLGSATLTKTDNFTTTVTVSFTTGFSVTISSFGNSLSVFASADDSNAGKVKGLLGFFDKNPANDLQLPDGTILQPNSTLAEIHYQFGLKWMISEAESLFTYSKGRNYSYYSKPNFVPYLVQPDPATLPEAVRAVCQQSVECAFDYTVTGNLSFANHTKQLQEQLNKTLTVLNEKVPMCQPVKKLENGIVKATNYLVGSKVEFSCKSGYSLRGTAFIKCTNPAEGGEPKWDREMPSCVKVTITTTTTMRTLSIERPFSIFHDMFGSLSQTLNSLLGK